MDEVKKTLDSENANSTDETKKQSEPKKEEKKEEKKERNSLSQFFVNIRAEFKKIIWPDKKEIVKQTATVIVTCLMFGVVIMGIDAVYGMLLSLFAKFLA